MPAAARLRSSIVALAAHGVEQRVAGDALLAFEIGDHGAVGEFFHALHFFAEAHGHAAVAQVIAERFDDLLIGEFEQLVALFNERDANAEHGEHAGVFDADDAAADHDEGFGKGGQVEHLVAVDDGAAVDGHLGRGGGLGADGDDDAVAFQRGVAREAFDATWCGSTKLRDAVDNVDAVAGELRFGDIDFGLDYGLDAKGEVGHGDLFLHAVVHAVDGAVVVAGEVEHGLAHGLGGNGAGVDADAADHGARFDHGYALLHFGGGHGSALSGRPGADDDQVIFDGAHAFVSSGYWRVRPREIPRIISRIKP